LSAFLGIDLGTTFSAIATIDETGNPVVIRTREGENITPSCVTERDGVVEVGEFARRTWGNAPDRAAARFKRDMGTSACFEINGRSFTPTELSSLVLKKLLKEAEASVGPVGEAVVTIPANFAHEAREATMAAARSAGLNINYIVNEPTAAALYYAFKTGEKLGGTYAVYDLGGGTFDVSIIRISGSDVEVVATNGIARLGGDDFDRALRDAVFRKYENETKSSPDPEDFTMNDAEEEKRSLSSRKRTTAKVGRELIDISQDEFEDAISSKIAQAEMLCESTIAEASVTSSDIRGVFLAGGSTRMPIVRESVKRVFGQEPISTVNVDEVVALGAALYSAYKGDQAQLSIVQRNALQRISVAESTAKCFGTISVSHDAARDEMRLRNSILIRKGERIPCSVAESFYTTHEGQESVNCRVTESSAPESDPRFVKEIWQGELSLPPGRPDNQEIRVTFAYDENQIMKCSFMDVETGGETVIDLSMTDGSNDVAADIERFLVE
jgi:molecular chaperone DnaK